MRILLALSVLFLSGCAQLASRETKPTEKTEDDRSEVQQLEDRLGI